MYLLSIIIPTKQRPQEIENLFQDVARQDYNLEQVQVVLFNDGRDQETEAIAQRSWPFVVTYLSSETPSNSCKSRNECLGHTQAQEAILFLDDDMRLEPDFLSQAMEALEQYDAFSCRIITPKHQPKSGLRLPTSLRRRVLPYLGFLSGGYTDTDPMTALPVDHLPGCMMMFRAEVAQSNRFDDWIGQGNGYLDDADYSYGIKQQGTQLWFLPYFSVVHLQAPSGGNREHRPQAWWHHAVLHRRWFFKKYFAGRWRAHLWLGTLLETMLRSLKQRNNLFPAWKSAWRSRLPSMALASQTSVVDDQPLRDMTSRLQQALYEAYQKEWHGERTFYGEAFLMVLAAHDRSDDLFRAIKRTHIEKYDNQREYQWHHEFQQYAFLFLSDPDVDLQQAWSCFPQSLRHKPTNWLLLRLVLGFHHVRAAWKKRLLVGAVWGVLCCNQTSSGLILDRRLGRVVKRDRHETYHSHQYHLFMTMLLQDSYDSYPTALVRRRLDRAFQYIEQSILQTDGSIAPRGRGAHQIFGYGALLYLLARRNQHDALKRVARYVGRFQNTDGLFPLVLLEDSSMRKQYWETYNNTYDYLPFFALCLRRALGDFRGEMG